jgi:hypothetical protein
MNWFHHGDFPPGKGGSTSSVVWFGHYRHYRLGVAVGFTSRRQHQQCMRQNRASGCLQNFRLPMLDRALPTHLTLMNTSLPGSIFWI